MNKYSDNFKYSWSEEKLAYHVDKADGSKRIADATLVAMTLMIAESRPEDMEMMVKTVVNLMG